MPQLSDIMSYYDRNAGGYRGSDPRDASRYALSATPPADKYVRDPHTGRYTRTPPARLPELSLSNGAESYRSNEDLRGNYFDRVPPVRPRQAFVRTDDLNSRGEEEQSNYSDEGVPPQVQPQPYMYGAPQAYAAPGPMYYPAPMMVPAGYAMPPGAYMQPQPQLYMQPVPQPQQRQPPPAANKKVRYNDQPTYYGSNSPVRSERSNPRYVYEPKRAQEPSSRFSYIDTQPQQDIPTSQRSYNSQASSKKMYLIPSKNKPNTLDTEAEDSFTSSPDFANDILESLISELFTDQIVPDLLIEVLSEKLDNMSKDHPYYIPSFDVAIDVLDDTVPQLIREIVVEATQELVTDYLVKEPAGPAGGDVAEQVAERLLNEAVREGVGEVVRETVQELASSHLEKASAYDVASDLMDEFIAEMIPGLFEEVEQDLDIEHVSEKDIINPVVSDMAQDVALETLELLAGQALQSEQRHIQTASKKRLLDAAVLDHLLETIAMAADPPGMDEEVAAMHLTEDAMLTILLEQYMALQSEPALTTVNKPIRRHHERAFTEVALDVLSEELCATLDEDMADYDDYEQGLWNPQKEKPPEWALFAT